MWRDHRPVHNHRSGSGLLRLAIRRRQTSADRQVNAGDITRVIAGDKSSCASGILRLTGAALQNAIIEALMQRLISLAEAITCGYSNSALFRTVSTALLRDT